MLRLCCALQGGGLSLLCARCDRATLLAWLTPAQVAEPAAAANMLLHARPALLCGGNLPCNAAARACTGLHHNQHSSQTCAS